MSSVRGFFHENIWHRNPVPGFWCRRLAMRGFYCCEGATGLFFAGSTSVSTVTLREEYI